MFLKKRLFVQVFATLLPIIIFFIILSNSLIVKYERNTGPELVILYGKEKLKKAGYLYSVNYSNCAYTTYEFDSKYGFENIGISFAFYKVIGSREVEGNHQQKAPVIIVKRFYPFFLSICMVMLFLGVYVYLVKRLMKGYL